jgi:NAD(P)H-nitrite reductase large subunit
MQVDPEAGRIIQEELEAHGLEVRVRVEAAAFEGNARVRQAQLNNGDSLDCQLVVVGKGVTPSADFLPPGQIEVDYGVRVDHFLRTSAPDVYAAGDVVEGTDRLRKIHWVNAIWPVAVEHGRVAGANMAGRQVAYPGSMGRNVMRIFSLDVMAGGMVNPPQDREGYQVLTHRRGRVYRRLVLFEQRLVGAVLINQVEQGGVLLSLIQRQEPLNLDPEQLLEPSFNFATLLP